MKTWAQLNKNATITAWTRTWSNNWGWGFTGGVMVVLLDRQGNYLHHTNPGRHFGVNGKLIPGCPSDRKVFWKEPVPAHILGKVERLEIVHYRNPVIDRLKENLDKLKELIRKTKNTMKEVKKLIGEIRANKYYKK